LVRTRIGGDDTGLSKCESRIERRGTCKDRASRGKTGPLSSWQSTSCLPHKPLKHKKLCRVIGGRRFANLC
jgi:hypothetical protein